jgi:hypothetical protein
MIASLSVIGRVVIVVAAKFTVIGFTVEGYLIGRTQEIIRYGNVTISGGGQITPLELVDSRSLLGSGVGIRISGVVCESARPFDPFRR